jgi:FtsH-binding integral membrane protein
MIAITALFSGISYRSEGFLTFFMNNIWLYYVSLVVVIGISVGMACHYRKFQKAPGNYILLSIYTIAHSYLIAVIIQFYKVETIAQAAAATGGMFVVLTGYACFTKGDMTKKGGLICTICECIFWIIIFQFVWGPVNKFLYMIICFAIICLLGVFIVHDTQMIVGGTNRKF